MINALVFLVVILLPAMVWIAILFPVWRDAINCWLQGVPIRHALSTASGVALQAALATLVLMIALSARSKTFGTWLQEAALWPTYAPFLATWAWATFYKTLMLPLLAGLAASGALAWALITRTRGWLRVLWPAAAVAMFCTVFLAAGQLQFHRDVRIAAEKLGAECLDAGSFREAVSAGLSAVRSPLHAAARKGGDVYGWSFRERDFYKVPDHAKNYARSRWNPSFTSALPACRSPLPSGPRRL